MFNLTQESFCARCCEIKPLSEFEQSTKITFPNYRLPWFKEMLTQVREFNQGWLCLCKIEEQRVEKI